MSTDPDMEQARLRGKAMDLRPPGDREDAWVCACEISTPHAMPSDCLTASEVETWRAGNPEATVSDRGAKALLWMQREFARRDPVEARHEAEDMLAEVRAGRYPGGQWCEDCGCETNHTSHPEEENPE